MLSPLAISLALTLMPEAAGAAFDQSHQRWTAQLQRFVRDGEVDYAAWKNEQATLDDYLRELARVGKDDFAGFSREEKLAFWINAYNAYTVRLILDHYPVSSIRSIGLLPWGGFSPRLHPAFGRKADAQRHRRSPEGDARAAHPFRHRLRVEELPEAEGRIL